MPTVTAPCRWPASLEEAGVDALAVACMEEAISLRQAHIKAPMALLEGVISAEEVALGGV